LPQAGGVKFLDISQNLIKINQTSVSEAGIPKVSKQNEAPVKSFNQILSILSVSGQTPQLEEEGKISSSIIQTMNNDINQVDCMEVKEEDLWALESILFQFIGEIKQLTYLAPAEESSKSSDAPLSAELPVVHSIQQSTVELSKQLAQWFQTVGGSKQSNSLDYKQIMQKLEKLVSELQSKDNQNLLKIDTDVIEDIKMSIEEINNILDLRKLDKNQQENNRLIPEHNMPMNFQEKSLKIEITSTNSDEITDSKFQAVAVTTTQPMRMVDGVDNSASQSRPSLSLSNFVPEVSEFAKRYVKIINGQSGGTEAKFNLFPEHLGHLEVKIISQEGQVSVQIVTDSFLAKESLEGQLQQLKQSLQTQGLQVQKLEIIQQPHLDLDSSQASLSFSQGGSGSSGQQPSFYLGREDSKKQLSDLDENDIELEQVSITYGGSTLKAASRIDFTA
jgi:flagellar hook-length control protein FliK